MSQRGNKALALWERWFDEAGDPWQSDGYGRTFCLFCVREHPEHDTDCIYVLAARLLRRDLREKVGL